MLEWTLPTNHSYRGKTGLMSFHLRINYAWIFTSVGLSQIQSKVLIIKGSVATWPSSGPLAQWAQRQIPLCSSPLLPLLDTDLLSHLWGLSVTVAQNSRISCVFDYALWEFNVSKTKEMVIDFYRKSAWTWWSSTVEAMDQDQYKYPDTIFDQIIMFDEIKIKGSKVREKRGLSSKKSHWRQYFLRNTNTQIPVPSLSVLFLFCMLVHVPLLKTEDQAAACEQRVRKLAYSVLRTALMPYYTTSLFCTKCTTDRCRDSFVHEAICKQDNRKTWTYVWDIWRYIRTCNVTPKYTFGLLAPLYYPPLSPHFYFMYVAWLLSLVLFEAQCLLLNQLPSWGSIKLYWAELKGPFQTE